MRNLVVAAAATLVAAVAIVAPAVAGGGNSGAAKACQQGGWQTLVRSDGTNFKNQGDCVSYAAQGGTFGQPLPVITGAQQSQDCYVEISGTNFNGATGVLWNSGRITGIISNTGTDIVTTWGNDDLFIATIEVITPAGESDAFQVHPYCF